MLYPGAMLQNRYTIVRLINVGGTAAVYEATDRHLRIVVALKELQLHDARLQQTLVQEAHMLARLRHPALPVMLDSFVEREHVYLAMQFIPGPDLGTLIAQRRAPFPLDQVLRWADQLLDALIYLHHQRPPIIHRDIKPHNLKLNAEGKIVLLDFGLAKGAIAAGGNSVASAPSIVGYTLHYAPLEQIQGEGTDERSDLFSLAVTLYELITGVRPPDALERASALLSGQTDPLNVARTLQSFMPSAIHDLLRSALSLTPHARPATALLFRQAFNEAAGQVTFIQPISSAQQVQDTASTLVTSVALTLAAPVPRPLPTGIVSLLCVRLVAEEAQGGVEVVVQASAACMTELGGVVFKATGRNIGAAFADATDALAAALAVQQVLKEQGALAAQALHSGMAEERDGGYFGPVIDRTERLLASCHDGQIVLSRAIEELLYDRLPANVTLRDIGTHRLTSRSRPEHIFQAVSPDLPIDFPPLVTLDRRIGNLPLPPDALIGREREVTAVCMLLRQPEVRLLTLIGPGGTGKTRLSLEATAELAEHFADGVCFVTLGSIHDPALVVSAVAQVLGVKETGSDPLEARLKLYLQPKHMLLLLDNFEQVVGAAPLIDQLLTAAPELSVLVTSRVPLRLAVERIFPVPPLGLPNVDLPLKERGRDRVGELAQYGAVILFVERVRAVQPSFLLTSDNAEIVSAICQRLDGLPLAIELAAARIRLFAPVALLARLKGAYQDAPLHLLTGGDPERPMRQQTLRQAIAWSYDLLDHDEQTVFRQLAVFVGGCTLEGAEVVCTAGNRQRITANEDSDVLPVPLSIVDILVSLLDKSLLRREEQPDGEPRFVLLETIREYGLEQLIAHNEIELLKWRHAAYCLKQAERAEPELHRADQMLWLNTMDREHDNMRAALEWMSTGRDVQRGLQLASALGAFWVMRGHLNEGHQRLSAALALAQQPSVTRAKALHAAGNLCFHQSDFPQATSYYEASLKLYQDLDDRIGQAWVLHGLGRMQRTYEPAHIYLNQSLSLFKELGDKAGAADALNELGNIERWHGSYAAAQACHEESVALFRILGDQIGLTDALSNLAQVLMQQGMFAQARAHVAESVALCRKIGGHLHLAWSLQALGGVASAQGDLAAARAAYEENLALFRVLNDRAGIGWSLYDHGRVMLRGGENAAARLLLEESLALFRTMSDMWGTPWSLTMLGITVIREGDLMRARACFAESLPLFQQSGNKQGVIFTLEGWASLRVEQDAAQAAMLFGAAMRARETYHMPLTPADRPAHARDIAHLRAQLTDAMFEEAWATGQAMTLDQASNYVLKEME